VEPVDGRPEAVGEVEHRLQRHLRRRGDPDSVLVKRLKQALAEALPLLAAPFEPFRLLVSARHLRERRLEQSAGAELVLHTRLEHVLKPLPAERRPHVGQPDEDGEIGPLLVADLLLGNQTLDQRGALEPSERLLGRLLGLAVLDVESLIAATLRGLVLKGRPLFFSSAQTWPLASRPSAKRSSRKRGT
jgi:hypothetical protein